MPTCDYIFFGILGIGALFGFALGFGRTLKFFSGGLVGIIISIFVCVMFGGILKNLDVVAELIKSVDNYATDLWSFLKYLHLGTVTFYIALFIVAQIARMIVIKIICGITDFPNVVFKIISKFLGAALAACFLFGMCLLGLAVLKMFDSSDFAIDFLAKIEGSFLMTLYEKNPIIL